MAYASLAAWKGEEELSDDAVFGKAVSEMMLDIWKERERVCVWCIRRLTHAAVKRIPLATTISQQQTSDPRQNIKASPVPNF